MWLQTVVWHLHNLDRLYSGPVNRHPVPNIEHELVDLHCGKSIKDFFNENQAPRVLKTRMPASMMKRHLGGKVKAIHWVMDPRDTLLKFHHLYNTIGQKALNFPGRLDLKEFFQLFQEKQLLEGDWFETTLSYLPYHEQPNVLFLKYEDAAKSLGKTVEKIAEFLNINVNQDQINKLINVCEFDTVTDWKIRLSDDQLQWYTRKYKDVMAGTVLEKTYL